MFDAIFNKHILLHTDVTHIAVIRTLAWHCLVLTLTYDNNDINALEEIVY